jgi:hypothetical protein
VAPAPVALCKAKDLLCTLHRCVLWASRGWLNGQVLNIIQQGRDAALDAVTTRFNYTSLGFDTCKVKGLVASLLVPKPEDHGKSTTLGIAASSSTMSSRSSICPTTTCPHVGGNMILNTTGSVGSPVRVFIIQQHSTDSFLAVNSGSLYIPIVNSAACCVVRLVSLISLFSSS